jgi:shikimate dehydrogenase
MIEGSTRLAGVVGWPIRHSLSPRLQNAWILAAHIDAVFVPFAVPPDRFAAFIAGMRGGPLLGLNVTAPHKERALALADRPTQRALAAGAANLLVFHEDGALDADNTDGEGLLNAFHAQAPSFTPSARPALILGAGGAARGAASAFLAAGTPRIYILNRNDERASGLAHALGPRVEALSNSPPSDLVRTCGVVVNATPAGLEAALVLGLDLSALSADSVVMDMVYRPLRTPLLTAAAQLGLLTVDGLEMLIGQARPSFKAIFGRDPPSFDSRAMVLGI